MKGTLLLFFVINAFFVWYTHNTGKNFYEDRRKKGKTSAKVYDIGWRYIPDYSSVKWLDYLAQALIIIPPLCLRDDISREFYGYIFVVYLTRYFINVLTILPKHKSCDDSKLTITNFINGHCYDKIFSGHFASTVLLGYLLYSHKVLGPSAIIGLNILNAVLIIMLRWHYTIDLVVAFLVVTVVYQNKIKI